MYYDATELRTLADAYAAATGASLTRIARESAGGHHKIFARLASGKPMSTKTAEQMTRWFHDNWPPGVKWPLGSRAA